MGRIHPHPPVLLILAAFSRYGEALDWTRQRAESQFGPITLESERFVHDETAYYERSMGPDLLKTFFTFERRIDPSDLVDLKHRTNAWEEEYRAASDWPEPRPLNIDPGYLTEAKLVLATTKDREHRLYLRHGIFAEVTLHYQHGAWRERPWTYPDYCRQDYHRFFDRCRALLRSSRG